MQTLILSALFPGGGSGTDSGLPLHSDSSANCGHQWRLCSCHTIQGTVKISFQHCPTTHHRGAFTRPRVVCLLVLSQKWISPKGVDITSVTYGEQLKKEEKRESRNKMNSNL